MADIFFQDVLTEKDGQQDTDGGTDEIEEMGIVELRVDDQVADAMGQLLDNDSSSTRKEPCRDAKQQHEAAVRHVGRTPGIELVNLLVYLVFEHSLSRFFGR